MDQNTSQDTGQPTTEVAGQVSNTNTPSQETVESTTGKVYSQVELDAIAAEVRRKTESKLAKRFEGVDVEHYRSLIAKEENEKLEKQKEKGEFEKILKDASEKANSKIQSLHAELTKIKVDGALINAASTMKAINPDQVTRLVRDAVKMSESGEVEVVDAKTGQTRYTDSGEPMTIDGMVSEFLKTNPHFVAGGPAGGGSVSNTQSIGAQEVDITKLDMNSPNDRKVYAEYRKKQGL